MKKIVFVGEPVSGYFAEEVAKVRGYEFEYVQKKQHIVDQINDIGFVKDNCEFIIFDVEPYIDDADVIVDNIKSIEEAYNVIPIIYTKTYSPDSELVRTMIENDLKLYVTFSSASDMKDQLEKAMTGFYEPEINHRDEYKEALEKRKEEELLYQSFKTVAVAGICPRIGTTTQALQMTKYLNMKGHSAAMVEINSTKYPDYNLGKMRELSYVEKIGAWFEADKEDEDLGMVRCFNLDMFYKQEKLSEIMRLGYDYYVYDYGCYKDKDFNRAAFLKEDMKIFVCGSSPAELDGTKEVAENQFYSDAQLIFSFTAEDEREDLLELMNKIHCQGNSNNAVRTFFAPWAPDPFTLSDPETYEFILPAGEKENTDNAAENQNKGNRGFGFFKGRKKVSK